MIRLSNAAFRRALLSLNGLGRPSEADPLPAAVGSAGAAWTASMVRRLGFVQVDGVSTVERAQHLILFSRNRRYRQEDLRRCVEEERTLFENWTHDAAILPSAAYPYWKHYTERFRNYEVHPGYKRYFSFVGDDDVRRVLERVEREGPAKPSDLDTGKVEWEFDQYPAPSVAKVALEYLWRTGRLAVTRREGRVKVYDLAERVIPAEHFEPEVSRAEYDDWACRESLVRLGAGTARRIAGFFDAVSRQDALAWCEAREGQEVVRVEIDLASGKTSTAPIWALASSIDWLRDPPAPPRALRLLCPFDPLIHDRRRTQQIFGFDYAVEIFVPAKKRRYGHYVLPILEGQRFTGRIDTRVDRKRKVLNVLGLWWEPEVKPTAARADRLERQLRRLARFCGADEVAFRRGYLRT